MEYRRYRPLAWVVYALLLVGPAVYLAWSQASAADRLEAAKVQFQDGEFEAAAAELKSILEASPEGDTRRETMLYLGFCELQLGSSEHASIWFQEILKAEPDYRLDAALFPPQFRAAFENARATLLAGSDVLDVVSLLEAQGKLSKATKLPKVFSTKWYKRWYLWAGVGAVAVGVAIAASGGGGDGYVPPTVLLSVTEDDCAPLQPGLYQAGDVGVNADVREGEPPYTVNFSVNGTSAGSRTLTQGGTINFTFPGLQAAPGGGCVMQTLAASVQDSRNNEGRAISDDQTISVCQCFE